MSGQMVVAIILLLMTWSAMSEQKGNHIGAAQSKSVNAKTTPDDVFQKVFALAGSFDESNSLQNA